MKNNNYEIVANTLTTPQFNVKFNFNIEKAIPYNDIYVILLNIPNESTEINNIYGVDSGGKIIWRIEDPSINFPTEKTGKPEFDNRIISTYVSLNSDLNGRFFATNFFGMRCQFDYRTGIILKKELMRW